MGSERHGYEEVKEEKEEKERENHAGGGDG